MSTRESIILAPVWMDGEPPLPNRNEWFIAETIHGDRVVLRALPEEWTYDYTTADGTRMAAKSIKRWMQFPDSEYLPAKRSSPFTAEVTDADSPSQTEEHRRYELEIPASAWHEALRTATMIDPDMTDMADTNVRTIARALTFYADWRSKRLVRISG